MNIPFAVGVYSSYSDAINLQHHLISLRQQYALSKILFFVFYSDSLETVLSSQVCQESNWDYGINYIRNARYNLIPEIWDICETMNSKVLSESSIYVVDFDNVFKSDLNHSIKSTYGGHKMLVSWNSLQSPSKNFPDTLSGFADHDGRYISNHPYKIVKAGFSAFAPNKISKEFLSLYKNYSIGDIKSSISSRLFTFYYSDQVALLFSLLDLKINRSQSYQRDIAWLDIATSNIVNLRQDLADCLWYPKGQKVQFNH